MGRQSQDERHYQLVRRALRPPRPGAYTSDLFNRQRFAIKSAFELDLTDNQRKLVMMYYCRQLTMKIIADDFDCSESSVSRGLKRAREHFDRAMRGLW